MTSDMTTIGSSLTIIGEVTSQEDMTVHGTVKGRISMDAGCLMVAPTGQIDAAVQGTKLSILGAAAGDLGASERIELAPTATVTGTLTSPVVVVRDGASFNGSVDMRPAAARAKDKTKPGPVAVAS